MTVPRLSGTSEADGPTSETPHGYGLCLHGIIPADVEVAEDARGVGEPGTVTVIRHRDIGALASETDIRRPLDGAEDLAAHERLLDATAAEVPVLPLRFATVVADAETAVEGLLKPNHDTFARALDELEGRVEYVVKARYVGQAVSAKREADARTLADAVAAACVLTSPHRPDGPTDARDAAQLAVLVDIERTGELEKALDRLAERWGGRVHLRLLGPRAPYDFAGRGTPRPAPRPEHRAAGRPV